MELEIHHHFIDRIAFVNGVLSGIALYPQVWTVLTTESVAGVSSITFFLIFLNSAVWVVYAIHRHLFSLLIASFLNMLASITLMTSIFLFS